MKEQSEALRLAQALNNRQECEDEAADELRRLHEAHDWQYRMAGERLRRIEKLEAQRDALLEALKMMRDKYGEYACRACDRADAAIKAAEENKHEHQPQNRRASVPV